MCQLRYIDELEKENNWLNDELQHMIRKLRWYRKIIIRNVRRTRKYDVFPCAAREQIRPGDLVKTKSKIDIKGSLDMQNKTRRCTFQSGMYEYCGREFRVFKKVEHFFDESKQKTCRCKDVFLLEGGIL